MAIVTIIRPPLLIPSWSDSGPLTPPIGPVYLGAALREHGHKPFVIDGLGEKPFQAIKLFNGTFTAIGLKSEEIVERILPESNIIGVSCMFSQDWPEIRRLIGLVRKRFPDKTIVGGGEHITAVESFTFKSTPEVDICVLGEGEETFVALVNALEQGKPIDDIDGLMYRNSDGSVVRTKPRARQRHVDKIVRPAWDLVPIEAYLDNGFGYGVARGRSMPIVATRGCPYQCTFCSSPMMWTTRWYARSPVDVLDEIASYITKYGATNFDFYDLTAIVKRDWIIQFTDLIQQRGLQFTYQLPSGTRSEAIDFEVTRRLYTTGCRNMSYAPESGSAQVLKRINKRVNLERLVDSIKSAVTNKLNIKLNIIIGFPGETAKELRQTIVFLGKMALAGVHDMSISIFSPYPGSKLYEELRAQNRIPDLSDEYFLSLAAYKDFSHSVSFTDHVSPKKLNTYRIIGFIVFYGGQYLIRPWRAFRLLKNFFQKKQESRLDKSLQDLVLRLHNTLGLNARTK